MKSKKSALLKSLIALLLCLSMLVGTTFAWFTDSVSTGINTIAAGNLDVELYHTNAAAQNEKVESDTDLFLDLQGEDILWEPGVVSYENLRICNEGDLALAYQMSIATANENHIVDPSGAIYGLSQILKVGVVEGGITATDRAGVVASVGEGNWITLGEFLRSGSLLPEGAGEAEDTWGVVIYWQPGEDDNRWNLNNGKVLDSGEALQIDLGINLIATQEVYESDSFGSDYDGSAKAEVFPEFVGGSSSAPVVPDGNNCTSEAITMTSGDVTAVVPAGVQLAPGTTQLTLTVTEMEATGSNVQLNAGEAMRSLDVHIEGIDPANTAPITVALTEVVAKGLNMGNYKLYHVENGTTNEMTLVDSAADFSAHNQFKYDPATGNITLYMASFSEVAIAASPAVWTGAIATTFAGGTGTEADPYIIANADQLAYFGAAVGGMHGSNKNDFKDKYIKLISDINLGDKDDVSTNLFYPIGYYNDAKSYTKPTDGTATAANVTSFQGTFDGNGHTIANFYQNTWQMWGNYDGNYYKAAMGLFGYVVNGTVKNLTVDHFSSDGEYTPTGVIAAYAVNSTFENIAITNCNPRVYNTGNGGIIGIAGRENEATEAITLKNITVDNSNKISALWGSYDVACGGLVGMYRGNADNSGDTISFENCHVSAQMDVYNDVCANYQYYAYRYAGMIIGSVRHNTTVEIDGAKKTIPNMAGISAENCTVNYGSWNHYYYCEFESNGKPSYAQPGEYKFSRVPHSELNFTDANGNNIIDTEKEIASVTGCKHDHEAAGKVDGQEVLKENNQAIYLPFYQLFTGYSWGVSSIGLKEYSGIVTNLGITEGDQEESVVKFEANSNDSNLIDKKQFKNGQTILIGDLFRLVQQNAKTVEADGITVDAKNLNVFVSPVGENSTASGEFKRDENNWRLGELTLHGEGDATVTITDYKFCNETTVNISVIDLPETDTSETGLFAKFDKKFVDKGFVYRVGNQNTVALGSLFELVGDYEISDVAVEIENISGSAGGSFARDTGDWAKREIEFTGTGCVKVELSAYGAKKVELVLEVVDAVNATGATSATANNVVLLDNCGFSSLEVSGGYTLYGNGFTMTCGSDSAALDMGYSFVTLNNGTLDNVQIVTPNFDYAVLYKSNMTESGNRSETTDRTRYYNVKSGVMVSGNSQILNSRISGARAAVNVTGGNLLIDNSRIELGAVASLLVGSANSVTLRDVTLVQKPTASTYDPSKTLMGFSVLFVCDANGDAAPVTIEGELVQNAWVNEEYKKYVPSDGQSIISTVLGKTDYLHDLDGDGKNESLNLGFAYMPESLTSKVNATTITDNRTNKNDVPYDYAEISVFTSKTYVYSYKNSNGTGDSFKTESNYEPNKQGDIITVNYSDTTDGLESGKTFGTDGWVYELNVDLDKASGYKLDFSKLSMSVNGKTVTDFKVNDNAKPTSPVAVTAGGVTYTLTATIDGKEYTATFKVTGTETSKESPSKISGPTTAGFGVAKSYGGDWSGAADVLTGVKIKYWSVAENKYVEYDFSNFTVPGDAGKLNGTNNYWEYIHTNNDFTLKVTNTVAIHSGKSVYGMPIRGTDGKLYFTISSTTGYVGSGTTSRAITMQYEFTDNNGGEKLTFTHTFNISYSKDDQYSYSDLSGSGKLTKLKSSGGSSPCVTPDTLITLADGTQKRIDEVTYADQLLVWNFYKGEYATVPAAIIFDHGYDNNTVIKLNFSDGTSVKVVNLHQFFDADLNKLVSIDADSVADYVGHKFVKQNGNGYKTVKLVDYTITEEYCEAWGIISAEHYNIFVEGMLSADFMKEDFDLFNYFEVGQNMKFDEAKMQADIAKYGLYTYADFAEYLTYEQFVAFNVPYFKIAVGRGDYTYEGILKLIETYLSN